MVVDELAIAHLLNHRGGGQPDVELQSIGGANGLGQGPADLHAHVRLGLVADDQGPVLPLDSDVLLRLPRLGLGGLVERLDDRVAPPPLVNLFGQPLEHPDLVHKVVDRLGLGRGRLAGGQQAQRRGRGGQQHPDDSCASNHYG